MLAEWEFSVGVNTTLPNRWLGHLRPRIRRLGIAIVPPSFPRFLGRISTGLISNRLKTVQMGDAKLTMRKLSPSPSSIGIQSSNYWNVTTYSSIPLTITTKHSSSLLWRTSHDVQIDSSLLSEIIRRPGTWGTTDWSNRIFGVLSSLADNFFRQTGNCAWNIRLSVRSYDIVAIIQLWCTIASAFNTYS